MSIIKKIAGVVLVVGSAAMLPGQLTFILLAFWGGLTLLASD